MRFSTRLPRGDRARRAVRRTLVLPAALAALAGGTVLTGVAWTGTPAGAAPTYTYTTLDSSHDPTFNQLLGINDQQVIVGYFGIGSSGHPNQGYAIVPPYGQADYTYQNFPGSAQTQITGINDLGQISGFWASASGANSGFVSVNGSLVSVVDPNTTSSPKVDQLLGRNDNAEAVGFYADAAGNTHSFEYSVSAKTFTAVNPPKAVSSLATGINDENSVVGTLTTKGGAMEGYLVKGKTVTEFKINGSSQTMALGVNDVGQVVGSYVDGAGNTDGFVYDTRTGDVTTIDEPHAVGPDGTVVNGINNGGSLVGFYTDAAGNVDGFTAVPSPTPAD